MGKHERVEPRPRHQRAETTFPEVRGYRLIHGHHEGGSCHIGQCRYEPTWLTRQLDRVLR